MAKAVAYQLLNALNYFITDLMESESFRDSKVQRRIMALIGVARGYAYYDNPSNEAAAFLRKKISDNIVKLEEVAKEHNDDDCLSKCKDFKEFFEDDNAVVKFTGKTRAYEVYDMSLDLPRLFVVRKRDF